MNSMKKYLVAAFVVFCICFKNGHASGMNYLYFSTFYECYHYYNIIMKCIFFKRGFSQIIMYLNFNIKFH